MHRRTILKVLLGAIVSPIAKLFAPKPDPFIEWWDKHVVITEGDSVWMIPDSQASVTLYIVKSDEMVVLEREGFKWTPKAT